MQQACAGRACAPRIARCSEARRPARAPRRPALIAHAVVGSLWEQLVGRLGGGGDAREVAEKRKRLRATSAELLSLLRAAEQPSGAERASALLDELVAGGEGQPFVESSLGGGPWVVRYTRGRPLLWNVTYNTGRMVNSGNRASQEFDPAVRSAANKVELSNPDTYIAAYGTYEPVDDSPVLPKAVRASIAQGELRAWGRSVPLPIAGQGNFEVVYIDEGLRVFRSGAALAVQVCATLLD